MSAQLELQRDKTIGKLKSFRIFTVAFLKPGKREALNAIANKCYHITRYYNPDDDITPVTRQPDGENQPIHFDAIEDFTFTNIEKAILSDVMCGCHVIGEDESGTQAHAILYVPAHKLMDFIRTAMEKLVKIESFLSVTALYEQSDDIDGFMQKARTIYRYNPMQFSVIYK